MTKVEQMSLDLQKELKFDITNLDKVLVRLPYLYSEYLQEWYNASRAIDKLEIEMSNMYAELFGHYKIHFEIDLTTAEVKSMIENNVERNEIKTRLYAAKTYVEFLEKSMQTITDARWSIKSLLDYNLFISGSR